MSKQKKKGFTLIELLAVIVVLAIILVIAVPKILEVIENARLKAYEDSVNLMIKQAHLDYGSKNVTGSKVEYPVSYEYGIDSDGETIQTNEKEVGLLNFKGDKPSEGTIVVDELGKVTVQNLVSKDRKFCAIKGAGEKNATVGRATELNCIEDDNTPTPVPDIDPCELEIDKNDENIMYIDSVEDMYAFSDSVNNGNTYSGKTIDEKNEGKNEEIINNVKDKDTLENLQKVDENILLTSLGLIKEEVDDYVGSIPAYNEPSENMYLAVKPSKGNEKRVKSALDTYVSVLIDRVTQAGFEGEDKPNNNQSKIDMLNNMTKEEYNGYYIYVSGAEKDTLVKQIKDIIK